MIAQMQKRARGISRVGKLLLPNLHVTGLPPAWLQLLDDPITALDRCLASVTSVPTPDSEENSTGTMIDGTPPHTFRHPQQSPVSPQIAYDPTIAVTQRQAPGISRVGGRLFPELGGTGLSPAWSQVLGDSITALDRRLASVTSVPISDSEENSTGTMIDGTPPHTFRHPQQSPVSSQIAYDPAIAVTQRQAPGISRVGSRLFPDLGVTGYTRASETPTENTRDETAAPPNLFAFGTVASPPPSASPTALLPADISPAFRSSGVRIPPKPNFAAAGQSSSRPKDQSGRTKLVPFSGLAEMLHPPGPADESRIDPHSLEPTEAEPTAPAGSHPSSQAMTVEAVLEQLEQRLQFEFLRTYGSSGE